jgi:hypothetical protein
MPMRPRAGKSAEINSPLRIGSAVKLRAASELLALRREAYGELLDCEKLEETPRTMARAGDGDAQAALKSYKLYLATVSKAGRKSPYDGPR